MATTPNALRGELARPRVPNFSSGPCAKRPGWSLKSLNDAALGRSHRAKIGKAKLKQAIDLTREVLEVPADYLIGIVPASDTGAYEMAMWTMLGARPVTMAAWESFGEGWVTDAVKQLKLTDIETVTAPYGALPNLKKIDTRNRDVCFTWNGTTSGVRVPDANWIAADRQGLTFCDATSSAFAQRMDWSKLESSAVTLALRSAGDGDTDSWAATELARTPTTAQPATKQQPSTRPASTGQRDKSTRPADTHSGRHMESANWLNPISEWQPMTSLR